MSTERVINSKTVKFLSLMDQLESEMSTISDHRASPSLSQMHHRLKERVNNELDALVLESWDLLNAAQKANQQKAETEKARAQQVSKRVN